MNILLPVYQYPTLTVLIDDSQNFMDSIAFHLFPRLPCKKFRDAHQALEWLRQEKQGDTYSNQPIRVSYDENNLSFERRSVAIEVSQIYRTVTNKNRFLMPAVLVIDYAMPQMNGLEFCQAIQEMPFKKILLTGQADEEIAINAFNCRLIDQYIKKSAPDALECLETGINNLRKDFFLEQSRTLRDLLIRHSYTFLNDPSVGELVYQLCERYGYIEFYLFPNPMGILFFDHKGKATLMVIETESGLISQYEVARDQNGPIEMLSALREFRIVPFFSDSGGMYDESINDDWLSYCLPAQVCKGRQNFYWALFDLPPQHIQAPIYSYAEFLQEQAVDITS